MPGPPPSAPVMSAAQPAAWGVDTGIPQDGSMISNGFSGWWRRFGAHLIDGVVTGAVVMIITGIAAIFFISSDSEQWKRFIEDPDALQTVAEGGSSSLVPDSFLALIGVFILAAFTVSILYYTILISGRRQSTWGQRAVGILVVTREGRRLSGAHAFGRWAAKLIYVIPNLKYLVYLATAITIGVTERKQALHDMMASTYVVLKDPVAVSAAALTAPNEVSSAAPPPLPPPPPKAPHEM